MGEACLGGGYQGVNPDSEFFLPDRSDHLGAWKKTTLRRYAMGGRAYANVLFLLAEAVYFQVVMRTHARYAMILL